MSILNGATISVNATQSEPMAEVEQMLASTVAHQYLGLEPSKLSKKDSDMVLTIQSFLDQQAEEPGEQALKLKDIMYRIGSPRLANSKLEQLYEYVKLNMALKDTENQIKAMER
jgi:hypothetical protein